MGYSRYHYGKMSLMAAAGISALLVSAEVQAQTRKFDIAAQSAGTGIPQFGKQADLQILAPQGVVQGKRVNAVRGAFTVSEGLSQLLRGGDLTVVSNRRPHRGGLASAPRCSWPRPRPWPWFRRPLPWLKSPKPSLRSTQSSSPASAPAWAAPLMSRSAPMAWST